MNPRKYILLTTACLFGLFTQVSAQDLPTGEVDVVRSFEARLAEAERVTIDPKLPNLDTSLQRQQYRTINRQLEVEYPAPTIRPRGIRRERPDPGYNGYAKFGIGTPNAFTGEFNYNLVGNEDFEFGIDGYHNSANNDNNVENQRFSVTDLGVDGTYYFDQGFAVEAGLGYRTQSLYYYGYNDLNEELGDSLGRFSFSPEQVRQRFNTIDLHGKIFNGERTLADFNYEAGVDLYILDDEFAARETGFVLNLGATKWFNDKDPLDIRLISDFTSYKDTSKQSLNNFSLQPSYTIHSDRFQLKLGFNLTSSDDNFGFYPDMEASANLVDGVANIFLGATGGLQKYNMRTITDYNPFVETRLDIRNADFIHYYGGLKGGFAGFTYRAEVGYKNVDNLALYQLDDPLDTIPQFQVLYDTANIVTFQGTIVYPVQERFFISGTVTQNIYSLDREEKPWHLPAFTVNVGARYITEDNKTSVRADFFLENGVPYRATDGTAQNLNALFDISLTGEYFFSENIGGFVTLNNLANNRRQRYFRYPTLGLNALFGLTARF